MTPERRTPASRPDTFFSDWKVFCREALAERVRKNHGDMVAIILAAGVLLDARAMSELIQTNKQSILKLADGWGVKGLAAVLGVAAVGARSDGAMGMSILQRMLGQHSTAHDVEVVRIAFSLGRREFEDLHEARWVRRELRKDAHHGAAERLFARLVNEPLE